MENEHYLDLCESSSLLTHRLLYQKPGLGLCCNILSSVRKQLYVLMEFLISGAESFVQHLCYLNKYQNKLSRHWLGKPGCKAQLLKAEIHCTSFLDSIFLAALDQL